ncbi:DUF2589 domain-containing protein [Bacillus sp. NP157]|nr:DUF2589 domain-containing protein [Bacillus sp. NP157]
MSIIQMSDQFRGLPMGDLIGAPLQAASEAQVRLAQATSDFIKVVGFMPDASGAVGETRTSVFKFKRPIANPDPNGPFEEEVEMEVPLLSIVKIPTLSVNSVDITFDMEVKSSATEVSKVDNTTNYDATASFGWGFFSAKVNVSGSVATHKENTRTSDNSAKYHVSVQARDEGMPEGLASVMDILQTACVPKTKPAVAVP